MANPKRVWPTRTDDRREVQGFRRSQNDDNFEKANKVPGDVENNIPILDGDGDLKDSGYSFDDVKLKKSSLRTVINDYQIVLSDGIIWVDASSGPVEITLISANGITGQEFEIKKIDSTFNEVTVSASGAETIYNDTEFILYLEGETIDPRSDGSNFG